MSESETVTMESIEAASSLLADHLPASRWISVDRAGLVLKDESSLPTGSFKVRGALNRLMSDAARARGRGVVAASAGNHGMGVAYASRLLEAAATIVVPAGAVRVKVAGIRALGADIIQVEGGYAAAESYGIQLARERGAVWVSPYNDGRVVSGQGVAGLELLRQLGPSVALDEVYVPVGGGGLAAGLGTVFKHLSPGTRVVGVQPAASPFLAVAFGGGDRRAVVERATAADGLAGDIEEGAITVPLVRSVVDAMVLVSEDAIREAAGWAWREARLRIEPSAGVALAAWLAYGRGHCAVIISGGNADPAWLAACGIPTGGP